MHASGLICLMRLRLRCALQDINRFDLYSNPEEGGMTSDPILQLRKLRALHFLLCYKTSGQEQLKGRGLLMVDCFSGYSPLPGQGRQNAGIVRNLVTMSLQRGGRETQALVQGLLPPFLFRLGPYSMDYSTHLHSGSCLLR